MKTPTLICMVLLVAAPAAGFAEDKSYPDFRSIAKQAPDLKEPAPVAASSDATTQPPAAHAAKWQAWRKSMARVRLPKKGCFKASYPNTEWQEVPCAKAPLIPFNVGGGDGNDWSAKASGPKISSATGSFNSATTGLTGWGSETDSGNGISSSFSLQLNTNSGFPAPAACSGATNPSKCTGWQQFVFANNLPLGTAGTCIQGGSACIYVQYWLLDYGPCQTGWTAAPGGDCYINSEGNSIPMQVPALSIASLPYLTLEGQATGAMDEVILSCDASVCGSLGFPANDMFAVMTPSVLNLNQQSSWTDAEFNVLGNGTGSQAFFNNPVTIFVQTSVDTGTTNPPMCSSESFTGETNSLSLGVCCPYGGQSPGSDFMETNAGQTLPCGALGLMGDTHITTVNSAHYNFQSAGEFVSLRDSNGDEIQTRQAPVSTTFIGTDAYDGLTTCVSLNTAVAASVGEHRVTYEPNLSGVPDPSGLQLRIDGVLTTLGRQGRDLGNGGRVFMSESRKWVNLEIDFPDGKTLFVTPTWWASQNYWYLNVNVTHLGLASSARGIAGPIANGSWLPALPSGASLGPMPGPLNDRYVTLYSKFADAWRVTNTNSLFAYAPGTSTETFTMRDWPPQKAPCVVRDTKPVEPASEAVAEQTCRRVWDKNMHADCVFDVRATGNTGFAQTYLDTQRTLANSTTVSLTDDADPSQIGEWVAFNAYIAASSTTAAGFPSGTVQFTVDGSNVGEPITVDAKGRAIWQTSQLKVGTHRVAASYVPGADSEFLPSASVEKNHVVRRCPCDAPPKH